MNSMTPRAQAELARQSSRVLRLATTEQKNSALFAVAEQIAKSRPQIVSANNRDVQAAKQLEKNAAFIDRLTLTESRLDDLEQSVRAVAALPDPVGRTVSRAIRKDGLLIERIGVPLGVIAMIFEARPGVVVESSVLCLKAGSSCILRGGSDAANTADILCAAVQAGLSSVKLPEHAVQLLQDKSHGAVSELVRLEGLVDLAIPRGGEGLIRRVAADARVPVLKHYKGVCHAYVHESADLEKASAIILNGKCQRPATCNALETLLIDRSISPSALQALGPRLLAHGVELRGDAEVTRFLPQATLASEEDWSAEYLDLILAIRIVSGIEEAIAHIDRYGSQHSDVIVAEDPVAKSRFLNQVDSAAVFVNASTRLCDGSELGLGTEIGISTDKLHARGPMGLEELTTYQWRVSGEGHVRR